MFLRKNGLEEQIKELHRRGKLVVGICGGYQMLGKKLKDPYHVESDLEEVEGIGLLDTETTFELEKTTTQVDAIIDKDLNGYFANLEGKKVKGYEIHMGITDRGDGIKNLCTITEKLGQKVNYTEGSVNSECNVLGTYLHGIFDDIEDMDDLFGISEDHNHGHNHKHEHNHNHEHHDHEDKHDNSEHHHKKKFSLFNKKKSDK